jgi:hypothetical protein
MATEDDTNALNEGLNTPTDDENNPPGYGGDSDSDAEDVEETKTEEEAPPEDEEEEESKAKADEVEEDEPKPLTRGQQRIQALANEKKLLEQRAELLERQLEIERQQRQSVAKPQEEENLTDLEKWQRQADQTIRQVQFQNLDMQDRSDFLTQVSKNPSEAAYIDRVEQKLAEARKMNFNPKREDVLIRLMGEDARAKMKSAPAVKRDAANRVTAAKGKPLANKSNVAPTKTESTEFDRLKDIIL